jgi:hypothetical protein
MILLEWFTNSSKYGAHSRATGRVRVGWERVDGNGHGEQVRLRWRESGGPRLSDQAPSSSLGTELVKGFATLELRGRYEPRYHREGAEHLLEFPVREREQETVGLVYGGQGSTAAMDEGTDGAIAAPLMKEEPPGPIGEPLSEPDPAPSRVRSRPTRRRR